jgi:hypothetical protein
VIYSFLPSISLDLISFYLIHDLLVYMFSLYLNAIFQASHQYFYICSTTKSWRRWVRSPKLQNCLLSICTLSQFCSSIFSIEQRIIIVFDGEGLLFIVFIDNIWHINGMMYSWHFQRITYLCRNCQNRLILSRNKLLWWYYR